MQLDLSASAWRPIPSEFQRTFKKFSMSDIRFTFVTPHSRRISGDFHQPGTDSDGLKTVGCKWLTPD